MMAKKEIRLARRTGAFKHEKRQKEIKRQQKRQEKLERGRKGEAGENEPAPTDAGSDGAASPAAEDGDRQDSKPDDDPSG